ncbi:MAG: hypothetical protein RLY43_1987 [Bacteroidota bacterium]|jgi:hypothetical protein
MNSIVPVEQVSQITNYDNYLDIARYEQIGRVANAFAKSDLVPAVYKDKPHNCFIAIQLAMRLGIDIFTCFQNIYVVQGNPSLSAKLCISLANRSGIFDGNIVFTESGIGADLSVTASAKLKSNQVTVSKTMTLKQAQTAGWTSKPVWQTQPAQMLSYRTATQLIRLYAPDAILGMTTVEEWEDMGENVQQKRVYNKKTSALNAVIEDAVQETTQEIPTEPEQEQQKIEKKKNPISEILEKIND